MQDDLIYKLEFGVNFDKRTNKVVPFDYKNVDENFMHYCIAISMSKEKQHELVSYKECKIDFNDKEETRYFGDIDLSFEKELKKLEIIIDYTNKRFILPKFLKEHNLKIVPNTYMFYPSPESVYCIRKNDFFYKLYRRNIKSLKYMTYTIC